MPLGERQHRLLQHTHYSHGTALLSISCLAPAGHTSSISCAWQEAACSSDLHDF